MTDPIIQQMQEKAREKIEELVQWETPEHENDVKTFINTFIASAVRAGYEARDIEVREEVERRIDIAKTRKRMTPFQDTLFNYEVNALTDLLTHLNSKV